MNTAAMALPADAPQAAEAAAPTHLRRQLRTAERRRRLRSVALTLPLLAFLVAVFIVPLAGLMVRAIENPEVADTLGRTGAVLARWDGTSAPPDAAYAALAHDLAQLQEGAQAGALARRLNSEVSGALDYDELVRLWLAFPAGYRCRKLVVGDTLLRTLLNLAEFQDPLAGFNFQATGELVSPVGAKLLRWSSGAVLPQDWVLGVDERYALEQVTELGVLVEVDRLIDRQVEATAVSKWTGFVKLDGNAVRALDVAHS